jgi:transposase
MHVRLLLEDSDWGLNIPELAKSRIERCCRASHEGWRYDRRVLNEIFWVLRVGAPSRDLPLRYGPYTTAHGRFNCRRKTSGLGVA